MQYDGTTPDDVFIHNHWNIEIVYTPSSSSEDRYHIVRTTVQPYSIRHQFTDDALGVSIFNPIASCVDGATDHTDYTMVADRSPQKAAGKVLFTYDVTWRPYQGDNDNDDKVA